MFLIHESKKNSQSSKSNINSVMELYENLHEQECQYHNNVIAMIRLEHEAVLTENAELLTEGIKDFLSKVWEMIKSAINSLISFLGNMLKKIKEAFGKIFGGAAKQTWKDRVKAALNFKNAAVVATVIAAVVAGKKIRSNSLSKKVIKSKFDEFSSDCKNVRTKLEALVKNWEAEHNPITAEAIEVIRKPLEEKWGSGRQEIIEKILGSLMNDSQAASYVKSNYDSILKQLDETISKEFDTESIERTIKTLNENRQSIGALEKSTMSKIKEEGSQAAQGLPAVVAAIRKVIELETGVAYAVTDEMRKADSFAGSLATSINTKARSEKDSTGKPMKKFTGYENRHGESVEDISKEETKTTSILDKYMI